LAKGRCHVVGYGESARKTARLVEHSGHIPMTEEPGKFLVSLVRYARPIAEKAGDLAS
jgi:hypothetical protein